MKARAHSRPNHESQELIYEYKKKFKNSGFFRSFGREFQLSFASNVRKFLLNCWIESEKENHDRKIVCILYGIVTVQVPCF